jgi:hypothetical protein
MARKQTTKPETKTTETAPPAAPAAAAPQAPPADAKPPAFDPLAMWKEVPGVQSWMKLWGLPAPGSEPKGKTATPPNPVTQVLDGWKNLMSSSQATSALPKLFGSWFDGIQQMTRTLTPGGATAANPWAPLFETWRSGFERMMTGQVFSSPFGMPQLEWLDLMPNLTSQTQQRMGQQAWDYSVDFWQRNILFMDTMRERGNVMLEHYEAGMPPLLAYETELLLDATTFERPCNYQLLRIVPPAGWKPGPKRRPLIIIDPRAGHGPGLGGFKHDSEIGMGLMEGHPVYFVSFTPQPVPGQTIEDVELAEARFIDHVWHRHTDLRSPIVYGNCQAGWAVAMVAADRPDVTGPVVINGAPMSYWSGGAGINPMRLAGGLTGGAWATRLLCDLGAGLFDGAHLVKNFENLNPANTLWKKDYNLWANIDTERGRYIDFERWWTGFYQLNEEEILWIVNNLFVGDKLQSGKLKLGENHVIDMRNMKDPLVVFASGGDNITPPHQALHWISELYPTTEELKQAGQRIVYLINPHVGHLGIFVSAAVARREHRAIIEHIEAIRNLEPGLYNMVIDHETGEKDPLKDQFVVRFEEKQVEDVRFPVDKRSFEKMAAVSRANEELYLKFVRPFVRSLITPQVAEIIRWTSQARTSRYLWSDRVNPLMQVFAAQAEFVKRHRRPVAPDNSFKFAEQRASDGIVAALNAYRDQRDSISETIFNLMYS